MKTFVRLSAALALAATFGTSAVAAPETYVIDNSHTFPSFSYNHLGFSQQRSRFNTTAGKVVVDREAKTGSVDITIDMKSVDTGSKLFNEHIQGEDFLHTAKYPSATFQSTKVNFAGDQPSSIEGKLTLKGITRPVVLTVSAFNAGTHPIVKKEAIGANAHTTVKRTDFNMGKYAPAVSDEVRIDIAIEALKQ